mmetsp:Transcript_27958/g.70254  ORF Transcript_27958/g.70254 Transcript_27958/m.70254 type:complete len:202 (-) Transcript_27958:382-987(-)
MATDAPPDRTPGTCPPAACNSRRSSSRSLASATVLARSARIWSLSSRPVPALVPCACFAPAAKVAPGSPAEEGSRTGGCLARAALRESSSLTLYSLHRFLKWRPRSCSRCSLRVSSRASSSSSVARCSAAKRRAVVGVPWIRPPSARVEDDARLARFAASSARASRASVCLNLSSLSTASFFSLRFSIWSERYFSSSTIPT